MGKNIGGPVGPFNEGQSIFDFLDDKVLNQLAKALAAYKEFQATAPLIIHRGPQGDTIGLQKRIDNFNLVELQEDLDEDTTATAFILRRDANDDLVTDSALELEVRDSDIAVGGGVTKRWNGQRGIAFQNPYSKTKVWEFLSLEIQQGGTVSNGTRLDLDGIPSCDINWHTIPLDTVDAATPGVRFTLSSNEITISGDGPLKMAYKVGVQRTGKAGEPSDDSLEARIAFSRPPAGFVELSGTRTIGLIDDVDIPCVDPPDRAVTYFGTASCPMFYDPSLDGDIVRLEVRRRAGNELLTCPAGQSFFTFEHNR